MLMFIHNFVIFLFCVFLTKSFLLSEITALCWYHCERQVYSRNQAKGNLYLEITPLTKCTEISEPCDKSH